MISSLTATIATAKALFLAQKERLLADLREIDRHLAELEHSEANADQPLIPSAKPGDFTGQRAVDALGAYLRARREHGKIPFKQAVEDLIAGGAYPGMPRGKQNEPRRLIAHTLKIALPNKKRIFGYQPDGLLKGVKEEEIFVWLAREADEFKPRKRNASRKN
jgi:hypothetical protein